MIKKDKIGSSYNVVYNGMPFSGTITGDPDKYEFYKMIGLDIFEEDERSLIIYELKKRNIRFRADSKLDTLKEKLRLSEEE